MKSAPKPPKPPPKSKKRKDVPPFIKAFVQGINSADTSPPGHTRKTLSQSSDDKCLTPYDLMALNTLGDLNRDLYDIPQLTRRFHEIGARFQKNNQLVKALAIFKKIAKLDPSDVVAAQKCKEILNALGIKS